MNLLFNSVFLEHDTGKHPENASRLEHFKELKSTLIENGEQYLTLVHTPEYIGRVKHLSQTGGGTIDPETVASPKTYDAACMAAGAAVQASKTGDFALVRPPGHHAHPDHGGGFCVFNNVAVAAQKLMNDGKKVAVLDFDGHLGDGTESFFYKTRKVLYASLHQFPAYPGNGMASQIGDGDGKGYTVNVPLSPGTSDDIYMKGVSLILAVIEQFAPDVIAVSAGFDGHQLEPLLQLKLSANIYYDIGKLLHQRNVPLFAVLEGGYNSFILEKCVMNFIAGINGQDLYYRDEVRESTILAMEYYQTQETELKKNLSPYWKL